MAPRTPSAEMFQDPVFDPRTFNLKDPSTWVLSWNLVQYFLSQQQAQDATPSTLRRLSLTGQAAAIALKPIPLPALAEGLYRVSAFLQVTRVATVSSTVQLTIGFTTPDNTTQAKAGTNVTGNLVTSFDTQTWLLHVKGGTALTYQTTYGSVGAQTMAYALEILVERINA